MIKYIYSYHILSTGERSRFGVAASNQDEADACIRDAIADIEFTEPEDVASITLDRTITEDDSFFECEGCT